MKTCFYWATIDQYGQTHCMYSVSAAVIQFNILMGQLLLLSACAVCCSCTWSLEIDASHLHGVCGVVGCDVCVVQQTLCARLWLFSLAAAEGDKDRVERGEDARQKNDTKKKTTESFFRWALGPAKTVTTPANDTSGSTQQVTGNYAGVENARVTPSIKHRRAEDVRQVRKTLLHPH